MVFKGWLTRTHQVRQCPTCTRMLGKVIQAHHIHTVTLSKRITLKSHALNKKFIHETNKRAVLIIFFFKKMFIYCNETNPLTNELLSFLIWNQGVVYSSAALTLGQVLFWFYVGSTNFQELTKFLWFCVVALHSSIGVHLF